MERKIVYQIYPLSFKDSNNDGRGDIRGIISKLSYLHSLGINYLWVSPIFKTPFKDNGYDISDYLKIEKMFGKMEDLKKLIEQAKKYNIKIMLDMVFNHTSTESKWFKKWINGDEEYKNFYISKQSVGKPPTNWKSKFGGSAWKEYKKNHWYLHIFDETQADLNWDNKHVRNKLKKVIRFYINLGVKGFRFDVINLISKGDFIDDNNGDGRVFYTDGPKAHKFIQEISNEFPNDVEFLTVAELSSTKINEATKYGKNNGKEFNSVFTFYHLKVDYKNSLDKFKGFPFVPEKLNNVLKHWSENMFKEKSIMANFLNNHDQPRSVSRFIKKGFEIPGAKMLFALISGLPGIPYIFQGEEIGMLNGDFKNISEFKDIETINYLKNNNYEKIPKEVLQKSRDLARTPMQWNNNKYAGFSNKKPWIKLNDNYKYINVEEQVKDQNSILNFYKKFIKFLKDDDVLNDGDIKFLNYKNNIIRYERRNKFKKYLFVFSFNNKNIKYLYNKEELLITNYQESIENILKPYQFLVIKEKSYEENI